MEFVSKIFAVAAMRWIGWEFGLSEFGTLQTTPTGVR